MTTICAGQVASVGFVEGVAAMEKEIQQFRRDSMLLMLLLSSAILVAAATAEKQSSSACILLTESGGKANQSSLVANHLIYRRN